MIPSTEDQWQDAVDSAVLLAHITTARVLIFIEMGRLFGLIDDNGEVDIQACYEILEDAERRGTMPHASVIRMFIAGSY